jgi:hypothetical protein
MSVTTTAATTTATAARVPTLVRLVIQLAAVAVIQIVSRRLASIKGLRYECIRHGRRRQQPSPCRLCIAECWHGTSVAFGRASSERHCAEGQEGGGGAGERSGTPYL